MKKIILPIVLGIVFIVLWSFFYEAISFKTITKKCTKDTSGNYQNSDDFYHCMENLTLGDKVKYGLFNL